MKIGFLVDKISFGGGERILKMLIDDFHKLKHSIFIYTWNKDWLTYEHADGYEICILKEAPIGLKGKIAVYNHLKSKLIDTNPDCLIIFSLGLAEVGVWAAKSAVVPTILSERVDPYFLPKSILHRCLRKIVYRNCSGIVFQTEIVQAYFSSGIQKNSIVIPNPIMDDNLPIVNVHNYQKEIVAIGRLSEEKNFEWLIRVFSDLKLLEYKLRIFGDGPLYAKLSKTIDSLKMNKYIVLEGKVNDVINCIRNSDIFILSSNHEGMPNALIEAMAMGLACISTDFSSGGARSLIKHNENGLLVPVNDSKILKEAILRLVNDVEFKQNIKREVVKIRETNSKEIIISQWIDFILDIIRKKHI